MSEEICGVKVTYVILNWEIQRAELMKAEGA
jgi:hypothetical protein